MVDEHGQFIHARSGKIGSNLVLGSLYPHKITLSTKAETGKIGENAQKTASSPGKSARKRTGEFPVGLVGFHGSKIGLFRQRGGEKWAKLRQNWYFYKRILPINAIFGSKTVTFEKWRKICAVNQKSHPFLPEKVVKILSKSRKTGRISIFGCKNTRFPGCLCIFRKITILFRAPYPTCQK